jgi:Rne/Rng family ribonuclease
MRRILMNVADGDECRIAVIEDGRLYEYFVDRPSQLKHVGNIYKGIIENVEPGIQAAFVDIGLERNGFLHVSDVLYGYENSPKLTDLFPRTLRIREYSPEEAVLSHKGEQHVEETCGRTWSPSSRRTSAWAETRTCAGPTIRHVG